MPDMHVPIAQIAVTTVLVLLALVAFVWEPVRRLFLGALRATSSGLGTATAGVVKFYDWILPTDRFRGVSRTHVFLWGAFNLTPCVVLPVVDSIAPNAIVALAFGAANISLLCLNLAFLSGAFYALHETVAIMNGDLANRKAKFKYHREKQSQETRTDKMVLVLAISAVLVVLQLAVMLQWLHSEFDVKIFEVSKSLGSPYLDAIVAILGSLPFVSVAINGFGLADGVKFADGWGFLTAQALALFGAVLLVGTIISLFDLRASLRNLVTMVPKQSEHRLKTLLELRFARAPGIAKSLLRSEFLSAPDSATRIGQIDLAISRRFDSFTSTFLFAYPELEETVRAYGCNVIGEYVEKYGSQFDRDTMDGVIQTINGQKGLFATVSDTERLGVIVLPAVEHAAPAGTRERGDLANCTHIQRCLAATLTGQADATRRARALNFLLEARDANSIHVLLGCVSKLEDAQGAVVLRALAARCNPSKIGEVHTQRIGRTLKKIRKSERLGPLAAVAFEELWTVIRGKPYTPPKVKVRGGKRSAGPLSARPARQGGR
ncbi:MAG: hypothetical protein ABL871_10110 [Terricaulis sp.]